MFSGTLWDKSKTEDNVEKTINSDVANGQHVDIEDNLKVKENRKVTR